MGERRRDDGFEAAWAQIVAGYDQQVDDADRAGQRPQRPEAKDSAEATTEAWPDAGPDVSEEPDVDTTVRPRPVPWDDEGHYIPPTPPPLPRPRGPVGAAWVGVIGAPILVFLAAAVHWRLPGLVMSACILGFVGGMVFLILGLDKGNRAGSDDWDDGAQI